MPFSLIKNRIYPIKFNINVFISKQQKKAQEERNKGRYNNIKGKGIITQKVREGQKNILDIRKCFNCFLPLFLFSLQNTA